MVIDEAICKILSRAALCFSHKITEPKGLPPQQQPALKARTLSIRRRSLPVCCCDSDTANNPSRGQFIMNSICPPLSRKCIRGIAKLSR